jgi:hypothetical protein
MLGVNRKPMALTEDNDLESKPLRRNTQIEGEATYSGTAGATMALAGAQSIPLMGRTQTVGSEMRLNCFPASDGAVVADGLQTR